MLSKEDNELVTNINPGAPSESRHHNMRAIRKTIAPIATNIGVLLSLFA